MDSFEAVSTAVSGLQTLLLQWQPANAAAVEHEIEDILARIERESELPAPLPPGAEPKVILAAGGLVWRGEKAARRLAVIHRRRYDDWSLPKGKVKTGERLSRAARREVREETGSRATLTAFAGLLYYVAKMRPKLVFFWHMEALEAGQFEDSSEVDQLAWLSVPEALSRLTYDMERDLLEKAAAGNAP